MDSERSTYIVSSEKSSGRLDSFLAFVEPDLTRSQAKLLIQDGCVRINGSKAQKAGQLVSTDDEIELIWPDSIGGDIIPQDIPLEIIYEDEDLLALSKAPGVVVHPAPGHPDQTLVNGILGYLGPKMKSVGGAGRVGLIHRLDKDTSGVILFAKNNKVHKEIQKQFADRTIEKYYTALTHGHLQTDKGTIDAPIKRSSFNRKKMQVSASMNAKHAITHFEVAKNFRETQLLDIRLETGRTHQIRIHFASISHPVVGDPVYGNPKINTAFKRDLGLRRQFLHASRITFTHPTTKKRLTCEAPLSKDLASVLEKLEASV